MPLAERRSRSLVSWKRARGWFSCLRRTTPAATRATSQKPCDNRGITLDIPLSYPSPSAHGPTFTKPAAWLRRVSGRNQLVGRIDQVRISGLMAEVKISIGEQQITSIITATSAREMHLKPGQTAVALIKATEVMILRVGE